MDHGANVSDILADTYANQLAKQTSQDPASRERTIQLGFQLGKHYLNNKLHMYIEYSFSYQSLCLRSSGTGICKKRGKILLIITKE